MELESPKLRAHSLHLYDALDAGEFRIFELHPSTQPEEPLVGSLHHVDLHEPRSITAFEALSYAWGTFEGMKPVYIDGRIHRIRNALHDALSAIRLTGTSLYLFVDAICINMHDLDELSTQVTLIKDIFQEADNVIIWLGESQEDTPAVFKSLDRLNATHDLDYFLRSDEASTAILGAGNLLSRQWFTRVWTVQELVVARQASIHVGRHSLPWAVFQAAIDILGQKGSLYPKYIDRDQIQKAIQILQLLKRSFERDQHGRPRKALLSLEALVTNLSTLEASNPRDLIYAFLGIANDVYPAESSAFDPLVMPDYSKPVRDVYLEFVHFCVKQSGSLDILFRPWVPDYLIAELPSWMWTANKTHIGPFKTGFSFVAPAGESLRTPYNASGGVGVGNVTMTFKQKRELIVKGFRLMTIGSTTSAADEQIIPLEWLRFSNLSRYDLYRLLLGARDDNGDEFTVEGYQKYVRDHQLALTDGPILPGLGTKPSTLQTRQRLISLSYNRRLALGTANTPPFALVPADSRKGDDICVLDGCSIPVVLRETNRADNRRGYELIGGCYVHSTAVMNPIKVPVETKNHFTIEDLSTMDTPKSPLHIIHSGPTASLSPASENPKSQSTVFAGPVTFLEPASFEAGAAFIGPAIFKAKVVHNGPTTYVGPATFHSETIHAGPTTYVGAASFQAEITHTGSTTHVGSSTFNAETVSTETDAARDNPIRVFRMHWTCSCGYRGLDQYIEQKPGAVAELALRLRQRNVQVTLDMWDPSSGVLDSLKYILQQMLVTAHNHVQELSMFLGVSMHHFGTPHDLIAQTVTPDPEESKKQAAGFTGSETLDPNAPSQGQGQSATGSGQSSSSTTAPPAGSQDTTPKAQSSLKGTTISRQPQASGPQAIEITRTTPHIIQIREDYLMVCIRENHPYEERVDLNITSFTKDREVFEKIKTEYETRLSWWRRWFGFFTVQNVRFVQFTFRQLEGRGVDLIKPDMPPLTARHYEFDPRPAPVIPPIGRQWMMHFFKKPSACENSDDCLKQFAKRVDGPPDPKIPPDYRIGWGLHLEERFDWGRVLIHLYLVVLATLLLAICWAAIKRSIQDGFSIAAYLIAVEALAVATIQVSLALSLG
ncbi:hypothetical protein K432DRAFT_390491 [Lepidopterella palustris CBS 459.81]|uniref:Heterokaryon incompatibility domain-containing protein n=1 Tax=Lepidopterella palustris CBS 459.81 TaxID=1314670 RepID=A0A8E2JI01_9PEZI|nr:hypothetical protein K432DRAFT_390491 [Lepidopterella palustris CBS 459.81]